MAVFSPFTSTEHLMTEIYYFFVDFCIALLLYFSVKKMAPEVALKYKYHI